MLQDLTVKDFIDELGSNSPAPGGGSVSALSASIASTLVTMVLNLTIGKKEYMEYEDFIKDEIVKSLNHGENYKEEFLDLMEKDTSAFLSLMDAFKMPKNTEEEIQIRKEKIQKGNNEALDNLYRSIVKILEEITLQKDTNELLIKQSLSYTNRMLSYINPNRNTVTYDSYGKFKR